VTGNFYESLIKGKNIALVGPGKNLISKNKGVEIDGHDLVVRTNRGCELIEKYRRDLGTRTDILYSCLIEQNENAGYWDESVIVDMYGVKYLCTTPDMSMKGIARKTVLHSMVDKKKYEKMEKIIPCRIVDHMFFTKIALEIECRPTTGYIAIYDILRHNPKNLSIYGFDFYYSGWVNEYKKDMKNTTIELVLEKTMNSKRHNHKSMWQHSKKLLNMKNVSLDDQMREVLHMEEFWYDKVKRLRK
tara:strand:- start:3714 stop:4448 length:735 start_codon:yes stop_codon:yes gene_type:complete